MRNSTALQQLVDSDRPWLADGGLETDIIFADGFDLPHFASFHVFDSHEGIGILKGYYDRYIDVARDADTGFVLDTATWRSGIYWTEATGRGADALEHATREAVKLARATRSRHPDLPMIINGAVGPAGDGYAPERLYTPEAAEKIHAHQIGWMAEEGIDVVSAVTMTHPGEAIGIVRAARKHGLPAIVSFTTETDGRLPNGQTVEEALAETDAATDGAPLWYMINCAHPDHFAEVLRGRWTSRIAGIRANASRMSHAELDEADELDDGDPEEFGALYGTLYREHPQLRIIGGCCGTDRRHIGCAARHVIRTAQEPGALLTMAS